MDLTIQPGKLSGHLQAIPSKSHAHRALICAAFADRPTELICPESSRDIAATADCLNALGACIQRTDCGYVVTPIHALPQSAELYCGESGSTLRFLLPIAGALGVDTVFYMEGRLPERPLSPLWEEMTRMGCSLSRPSANTVRCEGKLRSGTYRITGNISSQFITGLLLSLILLNGNSSIDISGKLESKPYVDLTIDTMAQFGVSASPELIPGGIGYISPGILTIEGDWSNAAFFLAAAAMGNSITLEGLSLSSSQGDRAVQSILPALEKTITVSAADIPDLIPILSVVAASHRGAVFTNVGRLRLKESDRVDSVVNMLRQLGGEAHATDDCLTVLGTGLTGGTVDSCNDHRIAMSAAIAATVCRKPVNLLGAECTKKSYPLFWEEYRRLGGNYEQYIR